jgi:DNA-binding transcriptional LysR family regulator
MNLFDRAADAARLTRDGERLIAQAHRLITLNDDVLERMQQADFSGEVRLGVPHDIVGKLMPPILRRFSQEHPNVLVILVSEQTRSLRAALYERKVDLALMTESEPGKREQLLLTDRIVWVGAKGGDAWRRRPVAVALGQEGCAFRALAIRALTKSGVEWRPICQVGSMEPVFATLEADMAVAPFLFHTVPDRAEVLPDGSLPPLPAFHINLRLPPKGATKVASELARHIREGFLRRYG